MSRQIMRVSMDFDAPIGKVWAGYTNPYYKPCPDCEDGITPERAELGEWVAKLMRRVDAPAITMGLAGRPPSPGFGAHDLIDELHALYKIIAAAGLDPETWGICPTCQGTAIDLAVYEAFEAWTPPDPPAGSGYQMWSMTTVGSPMSPVFATVDELCGWLEQTGVSWFGSTTATAEQWRTVCKED